MSSNRILSDGGFIRELENLNAAIIELENFPKNHLQESFRNNILKTPSFLNIKLALDYISSNDFNEKFKLSPTLSTIEIEIEELEGYFTAHEVFKLIQAFEEEKSFLLAFKCVEDNSCLFYWKTKTNKQLFALLCEPHENDEFFNFMNKFLTKAIMNGYSGIKSVCEVDPHLIHINLDLHQIGDYRDFNLLFIAIESGNTEIVKFLLNRNFNCNESTESITAADLAYNNKHYDILLALLNVNSRFPRDFNVKNVSDELKNFFNLSLELREAVKRKSVEKLMRILKENSNLRHFYDNYNASILTFAIQQKRFEIYEILLKNNIYFGPREDIDVILDDLSKFEAESLRELHAKHSQKTDEHILILMSNSSIAHDNDQREQKFARILRAYELINKFEEINLILKVVAATQNFKITFDFNRENVKFIDPSSEPYTNGLFYLSGNVYICAKPLLDPDTEHEVLGTLTHELCHFAMCHVYKNYGKPYFKDSGFDKNYYRVVKECKQRAEGEDIVTVVFESYERDQYHQEIVVRAPHMLAHYYDSPEKVQECKDKFPALFNDYQTRVCTDLKTELPKIKKDTKMKIEKEAIKKISRLKRIIAFLIVLIVIGVPVLLWIFYEKNFEWDNLNTYQKDKLLNSTVIYRGINVTLRDLFPLNSGFYTHLLSKQIEEALEGKMDLLNKEINSDSDKYVDLNWGNLPQPLKDKVKTSKVDFQGKSVEFQMLYGNEGLEDIESDVSFPDAASSNVFKPNLEYSAVDSQGKVLTNDSNTSNVRSGSSPPMINFEPISPNNRYNNSKIDQFANNSIIKSGPGLSKANVEPDTNADHEAYDDHYEEHIEQPPVNKSYTFLSSDNLKDLISDKYFKIGDQIPETKFYINRLFINQSPSEQEPINSTTIFDFIEENKVFILTGSPGTGKSFVFKRLSKEIKDLHPQKWILFIELKNFIDVFENVEDPNIIEIGELLSTKFQKLNDYERTLFDELFHRGDVVIFWDAVDEIKSDLNLDEKMLSMSWEIMDKTKNLQFISTRTQYIQSVLQTFEMDYYNLKEFTKEDRKNYLTDFMRTKNVSSQNITRNIEKVENFIDTVESEQDREDYQKESLRNPLLLQMIAELAIRDLLTSKLTNLYEIYNEFVDMKYKILVGKGNITNYQSHTHSDSIATRESHQYLALKVIFGENFLDYMTKKYINISNLNIVIDGRHKTNTDISRFGLVTVKPNSEVEFVHRTFAEFYIAQYLNETLYSYIGKNEAESEIYNRLALLMHVCNNHYKVIRDFIKGYLKKSQSKSFDPHVHKIINSTYSRYFTEYALLGEAQTFIEFFEGNDKVLYSLLHVDRYKDQNGDLDEFGYLEGEFGIKRENNNDYAMGSQVGYILLLTWKFENSSVDYLSYFIRNKTGIGVGYDNQNAREPNDNANIGSSRGGSHEIYNFYKNSGLRAKRSGSRINNNLARNPTKLKNTRFSSEFLVELKHKTSLGSALKFLTPHLNPAEHKAIFINSVYLIHEDLNQESEFEYFWDSFDKSLSSSEVKEALLKRTKTNQSILYKSMTFENRNSTYILLKKLSQNLNNSQIHGLLFDQDTVYGSTPLMKCFQFQYSEVLKAMIEFCKRHLSDEDFKSYLLVVDLEKDSVLQYSIGNLYRDAFPYLTTIFSKTKLNLTLIQEGIVNRKENLLPFIIDYMDSVPTAEDFEPIVNFLKKRFKHQMGDLQCYLCRKSDGQTIFEYLKSAKRYYDKLFKFAKLVDETLQDGEEIYDVCDRKKLNVIPVMKNFTFFDSNCRFLNIMKN